MNYNCKFCRKLCEEYSSKESYINTFSCDDCSVWFYFKNQKYNNCVFSTIINGSSYTIYNYMDRVDIYTTYSFYQTILSIDCQVELTPQNVNDKLKLWLTFS
jgi:hypothetical protein